jgi:L-asparagine transporter-like permease
MPSILAPKFQLILSDSVEFFTHNLRQIAALCLPFLFVTSVFQIAVEAIYPEQMFSAVAALTGSLVVYPIYTTALIHLMARRANHEQPVNSQLITAAIAQWGPLLTLKLFTSLLIFFGIMFLIVPGVWLWVRLIFAEFYLVLFRLHPLKAVEKSMAATRGHFGPIALLMLLTYVPLLLALLILDAVAQAITSNPVLQVLIITGWSFLAQFVNVVLFRAFMEVVKEQPGSTATQ